MVKSLPWWLIPMLLAACDSSVPSDAAPADAGTSDATSTDLGASDASPIVDAAVHDAEPSDALAEDAAVIDIGADGGLDAAPNDASFDAGPVDQGVDAGPTIATGALIGGTGPSPGAIAGVHYAAGATVGDTDALGAFRYPTGTPLVFSVGDVSFRSASGAALLSPWALAGIGDCSQSDELERVLVLLYSLDADDDPSNGVTIGPFAPGAPLVPLSTLSLADVNARVAALIPGRIALTPEVAVDRFIRQVDDEAWMELGLDTFNGLVALRRGQGVASDGTSWYFSGNLSLEKTDLAFNTIASDNLAIPSALALAGSDHIGDIDVYNGQIYAPIEDGRTNYVNPQLVLFDAQTLAAGAETPISTTLQTEGVPWVAVDPDRGQLYIAEWDPTIVLNIYDLASITFQRSLVLTMPMGAALGRIQGAEVFEGALYLSTDDAGKTVYKLNLDTGTVLPLFSVATTGEEEGITFFALADGSVMHTLNVTPTSTGVDLRHHARVREPLRRQICP